jgi:lipopolysaccharide/colanic/teichoic acid biosynthesis glycosyltransferase
MKHNKYYFRTILWVSIFVYLSSFCYAQVDSAHHVQVPEMGNLVLISTTGICGYIVRFARRRFREFKRFFDIIASVLGIVMTASIVAFTVILIKLVSPGSVFLRQQRVGLGGKVFSMFKLRTMKIDAEKCTGPVWAKEDDPRIIPFGKIIRKMHIDELPQLVNVFKGQMSIIGPRPERPAFVAYLSGQIVDYKQRLKVKPGITGLAQVLHKYDTTVKDVRRKIKFDLLYIRKMCLWVDMRILALTVVAVFTGKGAR